MTLVASAPLTPGRCVMLLLAAAALATGAFFLALCLGSADIPPLDIPGLLRGEGDPLQSRILLELRLPRVQAGFYIGGMLALAGCLMQVLLRNPLADPYILGVSGGAAAFALAALLAGVSAAGVNGAAFGGALLTIFLVFILSRGSGAWNPLRILLTGVVVAAGWGAIISFLLATSPADRLQGMLFWMMGDLGYTHVSIWPPLILLALLIPCLLAARALNLLAMGELGAAALGVPVARLKYFIYVAASLLTATAVTQAGSIGFVGLVVPHLTRLSIGGDHRVLLPVSVLLGGSLLVVADGLARTVISPRQLPVGVLTALIGVPLFLLLLQTLYARQRA